MSDQTARAYTPRPVPLSEGQRAALHRAAARSTSVRVLLDHITAVEADRDHARAWARFWYHYDHYDTPRPLPQPDLETAPDGWNGFFTEMGVGDDAAE